MVDLSRQRLDEVELVPFRAAIASRVGSIMTAHLAMPRIDPDALPATLSHRILTGLLREELGFKGLVVTDAMEMAGIAARYDPASAAVLAVKAGADMILKTPDMESAARAVKQAVERGEIGASRIHASAERILRTKALLGLHERRTVDIDAVDRVVSDPLFNALAQEIAERSITLIRDDRSSIPLRSRRVLNVTFTDDENRFIGRPFIQELRRRGIEAESVALDTRSSDIEWSQVRASADAADTVILSLFVRGALPPPALNLAAVLPASRTVAISFGSPYVLAAVPNLQVLIAAYGPHPVSQRAAVRALLGETDITGKLPVTLPGLYPRGHGLEVKRR